MRWRRWRASREIQREIWRRPRGRRSNGNCRGWQKRTGCWLFSKAKRRTSRRWAGFSARSCLRDWCGRSRRVAAHSEPGKIIPDQGRIMAMAAARRSKVYTPSQVSAATGLSLPAVHKAIEHGLIRPQRIQEGRLVQRLLSKSQVLYLALEAKGLRVLPLATRRQIAKAIERDPSMGTLDISSERVIIVQLSWVRKEVEAGLHRQIGRASCRER